MSMSCYVMALSMSVLLFILILTIIKASPVNPSTPSASSGAEITQETPFQKHQKHLKNTEKYCCRIPQPVALSLEEALEHVDLFGKFVTPDFTVLHRCTGGCRKGKSCLLVASVEVPLTFQVTERNKNPKFEEYTVRNHTECQCVSDKKENIK